MSQAIGGLVLKQHGKKVVSDDLDLVGFAIIIGQVKFSGGGGVPPYMGYIGMYCCEGYGFQAVYSWIGYINQSIWI